MELRKSKPPFRVPFQLEIMYFFVPRKWLQRAGVLLLSVLVFVGGAWAITLFPSVAPLFKDPGFVGLFGTLCGALLGAAVSGLVPLYIQLQQFAAEASIKKKTEIYEPLYDSLVSLKGQLERLPYPRYFRLANDDRQIEHSAEFYKWTEIKRDSKLIQVPEWLVRSLDQYSADLKAYSDIQQEAFDDVQKSVSEKLKAKEIRTDIVYHVVEPMLRDILVGGPPHLLFVPAGLPIHPGLGIQLREDEARELWFNVQGESANMESIRRLRSFYPERIVGHTEWLIREIKRLIWYINTKYEIQSDLV